MALDMEKEFERHQQGWASFAKMMFIGTVGTVVLLIIMALTLL